MNMELGKQIFRRPGRQSADLQNRGSDHLGLFHVAESLNGQFPWAPVSLLVANRENSSGISLVLG